ncbi:hypothetical protein [Clostridium sp. BJN0013]|jgi:signal recognition particle GTPase|uniref:hypothetical protein n=1 Tax=Clostridium sp. BJN0013 TaxID=3236840 RepID=UPI0034C65902
MINETTYNKCIDIKEMIAPEVPIQEQPKAKKYDFKQIASELQEILVKHDIYLDQFDPLIQYLKSKIMHETKAQKRNNETRIQIL